MTGERGAARRHDDGLPTVASARRHDDGLPTVASARRHDDGLLTVASARHHRALETTAARIARPTRTGHFRVYEAGGRTIVMHELRPHQLDNDLGTLVARELVAPGLLTGPRAFERGLTGLVLSTGGWTAFYVNTLRRLVALPAGDGPIASFAAIYARVGRLVRGPTVLDVGSCFGFLPLLLARADPILNVVGSDVVAGTATLASRTARRLGNRARFVCADAAALPLPDAAVDTVSAVHLLEHLAVPRAGAVLGELLRVARRRVVLAVPLEDAPDPTYGHVQAFSPPDLAKLGSSTGWQYEVDSHLGGWLVLDRPRGMPAPAVAPAPGAVRRVPVRGAVVQSPPVPRPRRR